MYVRTINLAHKMSYSQTTMHKLLTPGRLNTRQSQGHSLSPACNREMIGIISEMAQNRDRAIK